MAKKEKKNQQQFIISLTAKNFEVYSSAFDIFMCYIMMATKTPLPIHQHVMYDLGTAILFSEI